MTLSHPEPDAPPDSGVLRLDAALSPEARYKALLDVLPDTMVVVFDPKLKVLSIEGGGQARLPFPASVAIGHHLDEFLTVEQRERIEPHLLAALRGEPTRYDFAASNGIIWQVEMVPMIDGAGEVAGGIAQFRDVTAQREADAALADHARELERSNAELEQYAYIASHDLSEPLRMINGYLRLLQRRHAGDLDEDAQQFVDFALGGALRMRELIDDLLAYSRLGRDAMTREAVALQPLVEEIWHTLTAERDGTAPTLLATGLPVVMGDAGQFGQVFQNLLSNSLKFVEPGRAPVVEIDSEPLPGGGWTLTVQDEGIGIDPAQADRMFRMFQRLHTRDEYPGTGVGLAITRKVIEAHGGRIWAERRPGGGARFRIDLPAEPGVPEATQRSDAGFRLSWSQILDELAGDHDAVRVLLVEDDEGDRRLVAEMLRDADDAAVLASVTRLDDAIEPVSRGLADLVLLDLSLPDSFGVDGVRRLRAAAPEIPVVVLSGNRDKHVALEAVQAGAQDYLAKDDVDGPSLTKAMRYAVERQRSERRLARLALSDPLTGLPNRILFADRLEQALARAARAPTRGRKAPKLVVMFIDLDGFKPVNDTLGHLAGDQVLVEVARRLEHELRGADTVARLGGDEFTVLCESVSSSDGGIGLARRLAATLGMPYETEAGIAQLSAAIGIAVADPKGEDGAALLRRADAAMYAAKREGRGRVAVASGP